MKAILYSKHGHRSCDIIRDRLNQDIKEYKILYEESELTREILELELAKRNAILRTTFFIETGYGKSELWNVYNNPGGIKRNGSYVKYDTKEQGWEDMNLVIDNLLELANGNIKEMRLMYCPISDNACDGDLELFMEIYEKELEKELNR